MSAPRCAGWLLLLLVSGACASHSAEAGSPAPSFATTADALSCARNALADVGFLVETNVEAPPGQRSIAAAVETPSSVTARIVSNQQVDYVRADVRIRRGSDSDTTATLTVRAGTLAGQGGPNIAGTALPISSLAVRGQDEVVAQCHAKIQQSY